MLRNLTIHHRLLLNSALTLLGLLGLAAVTLYMSYQAVLDDKRETVKEMVDATQGAIMRLQQQEQAGTLARAVAQQQARELVRQMRFGNDNYLWINDLTPKAILHPAKPELEGQDLSAIRDSRGKPIFLEFVRVAQAQPQGGYVDYYWPKPGHADPVFKISYVRLIPGWNWVLGTGVYTDDVWSFFTQLLMTVLEIVIPLMLVLMLLSLAIGRSIIRPLLQTEQSLRPSRPAVAISPGSWMSKGMMNWQHWRAPSIVSRRILRRPLAISWWPANVASAPLLNSKVPSTQVGRRCSDSIVKQKGWRPR